MLSAPVGIPATSVITFADGFAPAGPGSLTCSPISRGSPT
jgi:hypothetical protein